jgi:putative ABC transport system permease protein
MLTDWAYWHRGDGRRVNIELIGLDESNVGGPWNMYAGDVDKVHLPESVIVDEMFAAKLGVNALGDEVEILGNRAVVRGLSSRVRTFTAAPFVFTSIRSAIAFDKRNRADDITYVMARCLPGELPAAVASRIREEIPNIEVLTSREFAWRSVHYWMLGTGIGVTVVLTAVLGMLVSAMVGSQTLFGITNDHLANYATLLAVGFGRGQLITCVLTQGLVLTGAGALLGSAAFVIAARASERTPLPLEMNLQVYLAVLGVSTLANLAGALLSVKAVLRIDPVAVFRG